MSDNYSVREIDAKVGNINDNIAELKIFITERLSTNAKTLERIENQTIKTNGRVNALENAKWLTIGGLGVVTSFVIPLVIYIYVHGLK